MLPAHSHVSVARPFAFSFLLWAPLLPVMLFAGLDPWKGCTWMQTPGRPAGKLLR